MGLINDKRNVFTTIGAYNSLKENLDLPDPTNVFSSINNKKDVLPFLLDVLKVSVGTDGLKELTGEMVTNMTTQIEPKLKTSLRKQVTDFNSGNALPQSFFGGIEVPVKNIDIYGKLKINPASDEGSLLYNNNTPNFDKSAYQAIQNAGTDVTFGNLIINYNSSRDSFIFKPTPESSTGTIGNWFNSFIGGINILDKKEFLTKVLDGFYGSLSKKTGKSLKQLKNELMLNKYLENIDVDGYEIPAHEYADIDDIAQQIANGVRLYDMGCGLMEVSLPFSGFNETVTDVFNSTSPYANANTLEQTINKSAGNNEDVQTRINNNKQTIRDNFFERLLKLILNIIIQSLILTPQVRAILIIRDGIINNGVPRIGNIWDNIKQEIDSIRTLIKCLGDDIKKIIYEFIFNLIVTFLIALLKPIIVKIIREKINQYLGVLKSLVSSKL